MIVSREHVSHSLKLHVTDDIEHFLKMVTAFIFCCGLMTAGYKSGRIDLITWMPVNRHFYGIL